MIYNRRYINQNAISTIPALQSYLKIELGIQINVICNLIYLHQAFKSNPHTFTPKMFMSVKVPNDLSRSLYQDGNLTFV